MCKSTGITLLVCWLFSQPATLYAQGPLRNLDSPHNLLSTRYILLENSLPGLESIYLKPIDIPGYVARGGCEMLTTPFAKPLFLSIQNSGLFYKYWYWSRSSPTNPKHSVTKKPNNRVVGREIFYALYNKKKLVKKGGYVRLGKRHLVLMYGTPIIKLRRLRTG